MSDNNKPIEIKVSVLEVIYSAMMPIYHRLNSLLEDVIHKRVLVSETDRSALLDYCACAGGLKVMFENYFEMISAEEKVEKISLPYQEYIAIMSMSKTVEVAMRTSIGGYTLQEH